MQEISYVLLVDDNADLRDAIEKLLTIKGYAVKAFRNGTQALRHMKLKPPPKLVITDLCRTVMAGRSDVTCSLILNLRQYPSP